VVAVLAGIVGCLIGPLAGGPVAGSVGSAALGILLVVADLR
jgi:hypothetical protein